MDILKAIKEGRTPTPGLGLREEPPAEETADTADETANTSVFAPPVRELTVQDFPTVNRNKPSEQEQPEEDNGEPSAVENLFAVDYKVVKDAQKLAKHAISALQYDDVGTAIENLEKALGVLRPFHARSKKA